MSIKDFKYQFKPENTENSVLEPCIPLCKLQVRSACFLRTLGVAPQCADLGTGSGVAIGVRQSVFYDCTKLPVDVHPLKQSSRTSKSQELAKTIEIPVLWVKAKC